MPCYQLLRYSIDDIGEIPISSGFFTPPLKIKILKIGLLHAREDQAIDPEPKFHVPRSSNGKYYGGQPKRGNYFTLDHMGTHLKNQKF